MLAANAVMLTRYVACLRRLPSLQATVLMQGANIVVTVRCACAGCAAEEKGMRSCTDGNTPRLLSALTSGPDHPAPQGLLGHCLFGEPLTARWLAGVVAVISGLALICRSAAPAATAQVQTAAPSPQLTPTTAQAGAGAVVLSPPPQQAGGRRVARSAARAAAGQKAE
jgi:hypothetical protein